MKSKKLLSRWMRANKLAGMWATESKRDPELAEIAASAKKLAGQLFELARRRESEEAVKADKGEILWTLYMPMKGLGVREVMRTPNRTVTRWLYKWSPPKEIPTHEAVHMQYDNQPYKELQRLWGEKA